jgi:pyruvate dehydrogenase E1 component
MVPFYTYYSMFGFQRVGDALWGASDAGARGFLLGATAGRTTLAGEGLQHQDGHSHVLASVIPACMAYDPAFAFEMATIIEHGIDRMYGQDVDVFYYLTLYNEAYVQPPKPDGVDDAIVEGMYLFEASTTDAPLAATILFSGPAHLAARQARDELLDDYGVGADLWSVTSYKSLREEAMEVERWNGLHPADEPRIPLVSRRLEASRGPIVAVTDYMRIVPDQIAAYAPRPFTSLGTDGYGRSDTREALRTFFEVRAGDIVVSVLNQLAREGSIDVSVVESAIERYGIDTELPPPWVR